MTIIGAKALRLHLDEILDRALGGEEIIVHHRFKAPVRLSAVYSRQTNGTDSLPGLRAFDAAPKKTFPFKTDRPLKELYHESISRKYLPR